MPPMKIQPIDIPVEVAVQKRWRPNFNPWKADHQKRIRVSIHVLDLATKLYSVESLRRLGNLVGKTLKIDRTTSFSEKGGFARICVEVDLRKPLLPGFDHFEQKDAQTTNSTEEEDLLVKSSKKIKNVIAGDDKNDLQEQWPKLGSIPISFNTGGPLFANMLKGTCVEEDAMDDKNGKEKSDNSNDSKFDDSMEATDQEQEQVNEEEQVKVVQSNIEREERRVDWEMKDHGG
ncbi:hypothetical protein K1719_004461 [Acacia pycnantha]|nr:hypothetical protein K1719_004461 [Acacia pycnantha]